MHYIRSVAAAGIFGRTDGHLSRDGDLIVSVIDDCPGDLFGTRPAFNALNDAGEDTFASLGFKQIQKITAVFVGVSLDGSCEADRDDIGISPGDCDPMTCLDRCVRPSLLLSSDIGFRVSLRRVGFRTELSLGHIWGFRLSLGPVRRSTGCGRQIRLSLRCGELLGFVFVHSSTS